MGLGWGNPLPLSLGGGPTLTELIYDSIRKAHGRGPNGSQAIGPVDGIRDLWTIIEARAIACALSHWEHALWQAFPHTSTSFVVVWENLLLLPSTGELAERQKAVAAAYTRQIDATIPGLREQLKEIDAGFDVDTIPDDLTITTMVGKEFGPLPGVSGHAYGSGLAATRESTAWPNFSDNFILRVRYIGTPTEEQFARAASMLNDVLPAWVDFDIYVLSEGDDGDGFYFDGGPNSDSFMDLTAIT